MAAPELGTKRTCPSCNARFYDLGKKPAQCAKCAHSFDPEEPVKTRTRGRKTAVVVEEAAKVTKVVKKPKRTDEFDEDIDLTGFESDLEDAGDIEPLEDMEDIDDLKDIDDLDVEEGGPHIPTEDDADEESIIDDLDTSGNGIIDALEEEEITEDDDDDSEDDK